MASTCLPSPSSSTAAPSTSTPASSTRSGLSRGLSLRYLELILSLHRLAKAGVTGLVVNGTTGEPAHLSRAERRATLTASREALDGAGFPNMPIIAGCGVPSTWETIELCVEAAELGAAFVLVLPPSYYKAAMSEELIYKFFVDVRPLSFSLKLH